MVVGPGRAVGRDDIFRLYRLEMAAYALFEGRRAEYVAIGQAAGAQLIHKSGLVAAPPGGGTTHIFFCLSYIAPHQNARRYDAVGKGGPR